MATFMKTLVSCAGLAFTSGVDTAPTAAASSVRPDACVALVAHRGGIVPGYPENTLAAFRHAIENGAAAIEIDLRGTKDGAIVVMHDKDVDRTTNGRGAVADMSLAKLRKLDAGRGESIPTYQEVLQLVAGSGALLLIDIKQGGVIDRAKVVRLTEEHEAAANVIVGLRNLEDLRAFRALNPNLRTIGFIEEVEDIEPFVQAGIDIIRLLPQWIDVDPELVNAVHRLGKPVWAVTGGAPRAELEKLIRLGVNGIVSDLPAVMSELQVEMGDCRSP